MGRSNKKKSNKTKGTPNIAWAPKEETFDAPDFYNEPFERRPVPNMNREPSELLNAIHHLSEQCSPTEKRFVQAYKILDKIKDLRSNPISQDGDADINELLEDENYVQKCVWFIQANILTDYRLMISPHAIVKSIPGPTCWSCVTELRPLESNDPQLLNVCAQSFVILLACSVTLLVTQSDRFALQLVHELHAHADGNYIKWEDLEKHIATKTLSEDYLRFALASVGVKAARSLYRSRDSRKPLPFSEKLSSNFLLDSIETFAKEQCQFGPKRAVGYWNLGWVDSQKVRYRKVHGLTAAADCFANMSKAYHVADEENDDFIKAAARIEAAACLVMGSAGTVGYKIDGHPVQARRDMRSDFLKNFDIGKVASLSKFRITIEADPPFDKLAVEKDKQRLEHGVPATQIDSGEMLLVAPWDVLKLWNQAMKPYDALRRFHHEFHVYGETAGWDAVAAFLEKCQRLAYGQYHNAPIHPGFQAHRDRGFDNLACGHCGKVQSENMACSKCKAVYYCSKECQRADWKEHKIKCKPV
jgi:hypothetical protein